MVGIWLAAVLLSAVSRQRARRRKAWLRSDVPPKVAYARLRAEIERQQIGEGGGRSDGAR